MRIYRQTMLRSSTIVAFPTELLVSIFLQLSSKDRGRCVLVCKRFRNVVKDSLALKYASELETAGYIDGCSLSMTLREKLHRIRASEKTWDNFAFTLSSPSRFRFNSERGVSEFWGLSQGVFMTGNETRLDFAQFPSYMYDAPRREWSISGLKNIQDAAIDPGEDLLVLIEGRNTWTDPYTIHFRTMSEGGPHPDAVLADMEHQPASWGDHIFSIAIVEDLLAVMFSSTTPEMANQNDSGELVIWDWKRGELVTTLEGRFPYPSTFSFITPESFMIPVVHGASDIVLEIYVIRRSPQPDSEVGCKQVAAFHFPVFTETIVLARVFCWPEPASFRKRGPFHVNPLKRIFAITVALRVPIQPPMAGVTMRGPTYTIFVHSDAFLEMGALKYGTGGPRKELKWDDWSRYARWTRLKPPSLFVCNTHGEHFLEYDSDPDVNQMHLWDFNPRRRPSCPPSTVNPYLVKSRYIDRPSFIMDEAVFRDGEVWSWLPYRRITSQEELQPVHGLMLDDERIIRANFDGGMLELDVRGIGDAQPEPERA